MQQALRRRRFPTTIAGLFALLFSLDLSAPARAQEVLSVPAASGFGSAVAAWSQGIYVDNDNNPQTPPQYSTAYEYVVVGAPDATSLNGGFAGGGQAFLYFCTLGSVTWTQVSLNPTPQTLGPDCHYGYAVAIRGGHAFIGAPGCRKVFVFDSSASGTFTSTNPRVLSDTDLGFSGDPMFPNAPNGDENFGRSLDYSDSLGLVVCGDQTCRFYSSQGGTWRPTFTGNNGEVSILLAANQAKFHWNGEQDDLVSGRPGAITFHRYRSSSSPGQPRGYGVGSGRSTTYTTDYAAFATSGLGGTRVLLAGPLAGQVTPYMQNNDATTTCPGRQPWEYCALSPFTLNGGAGPSPSTGISFLGMTAIVTNRLTTTTSEVREYLLSGNNPNGSWSLTPNSYGLGGASYGSALANHYNSRSGLGMYQSNDTTRRSTSASSTIEITKTCSAHAGTRRWRNPCRIRQKKPSSADPGRDMPFRNVPATRSWLNRTTPCRWSSPPLRR